MREQIYILVENTKPHNKLYRLYEWFITAVALLSIFPLLFKGSDSIAAFIILDRITVYLLFADYVLRWICRDYTTNQKGLKPFLLYPLSPFAIIDMLSLLPTLGILGNQFRILRMLRVFMLLRYSKNFTYISNVFKKERKTLGSVLAIAIAYIFVSALAMFTYEPDTFDNFFGALYWATTALTTVGYGDVYPLSTIGRFISMISSLFGIAVIALPAGIITAGFMEEIGRTKEEDQLAQDIYEAEQTIDRITGADIEKLALTKKKFRRYTIVMILGIGINQALSYLATTLQLPLWLDTVGTVLTALILQPAAGLLVGLADNFYLSLVHGDSGQIFYYCISATMALIAGLYLKKNGRIQGKQIVPAIILAIVSSTTLSVLISLMRTETIINVAAEQHFMQIALAMGIPPLLSAIFGILVIKTYDVLATAALVAIIYGLYKGAVNTYLTKS